MNNRVKIALITLVTVLMVVSTTACAKAPPTETEWSLTLTGVSTDIVTQDKFEEATKPSRHGVECSIEGNDGAIYIYSGIPLWFLCGWVDDELQHGKDAFNDALANKDYGITVTGADGWSTIYSSRTVARNNDIIIAKEIDGQPLTNVGPVWGYPRFWTTLAFMEVWSL